jgi:hypothetical protein
MDLIRKVNVEHTDLYYLSRTRAVKDDEVDMSYQHREVPEDYNYSHETWGYLSVSVNPNLELSKYLLDLFHPEGDGIPTGCPLFDSYFHQREKVIENPKVFICDYKEKSTVNLKRSDKTRKAEAQRVNELLRDKKDSMFNELQVGAMGLFALAIDSAVERHNAYVKDYLERYIMKDGINHEWVVENLYTEEQALKDEEQQAELAELSAQITTLRDKHRAIRQEKNGQRRFILQQHFIKWTEKIPEFQQFVQGLPIEEAVDNEVRMISL